ncbi:MAG: hypothetical protein CME62_06130 [Halobacteriovoraceae bacterium]|nr:hypothetical protein [Halobacteriovoraceae bacterium]|tara:strand:+ start:21909 stop:22256 length:348 start_codon:yes stop_codon:yes gene_type:complete
MNSIDKKNLIIDFILILLTGGLWNIWMQYRQIRDFNTWLGMKKYSFLFWLILTIITFGLYHIYHEYKLTRDMYQFITKSPNGFEVGLIAGIISATGAWIFVDLYQQSILNSVSDF